MEILKEFINGVCRITLNRPSVFNSFNKTMALQLQDVLDDCAVNPEIRAVLITGEGKAFCAGTPRLGASRRQGDGKTC